MPKKGEKSAIQSRISRATKSYMGDNRIHALVRGNQYATHGRVQTELWKNGRRAAGLATG